MTVPVPDQLEFISIADGVTRDFPYPKRFLQADEIRVLLRDANGVDTPQFLGQHFSIAGSSWPNGGAVSFYTAPPSGSSIVRYRATQAKQTVDLENKQRNDAKAVEVQLDRFAMAAQDLQASSERSLKFPVGTNPSAIQPLPLPERGKALVGNSAGNGYINAPVGEGDIAVAVEEAEAARNIAVLAKDSATETLQDVVEVKNETLLIKAEVDLSSQGVSAVALQVGDDKVATEQYMNAAVAAAGTVGNFDTLAIANDNIANIPDDGGVNILNNGSRNGFYVKQSGVLVKKSDATLAALDTRADSLNAQVGFASQEASGKGAAYMQDAVAGFHDEAGNMGAALMRNGQFIAQTRGHALNAEFVDYLAVEHPVTGERHVIYGIRRSDGMGFVGLRPVEDVRVYLTGTEGNRIVWAVADGRSPWRVTPDAGDYHSPLIEGYYIKWIELVGGIALEHSMVARASMHPFAKTVTKLRHIIIDGQSENTGAYDLRVINSVPIKPGFAATFNSGVRNLPDQNPEGVDTHIADKDIEYFINLRETQQQVGRKIGETIASEICRVLYEVGGLDATNGVVVTNHAIGGQSIERLSKGTVPYENMMKAVARVKLLADAYGYEYEPVILFTHGVSNRQNSSAQYLASQNTLQSDCTADINAITGGTGQVMMFVEQLSSWTVYDITRSEVPFAQRQAAINSPTKFVNIGQRYTLPYYTDGVHDTAEATIDRGARFGRALKEHFNGGRYKPLSAISAMRTGTAVLVTFDVPVAPLVLDTSVVSDPGNYGFEWRDNGDGNSVTIISVALSGTDKVAITLSAAPTGTGGAIGIAATGVSGAKAGPTSGARSCLRDSTTGVNSRGIPNHIYADHQLISVS